MAYKKLETELSLQSDHWIKFTSNMDHHIHGTQRRVDAHD